MSYAVFSCDFDTVEDHLRGYGIESTARDAVYDRAVPRLLDLMQDLAVPSVAFMIARDAMQQRDRLRQMAKAGVEIASHSLTHPEPFARLDDEPLRHEVDRSRSLLSEAAAEEVVGFRAPGWNVDQRVIEALGAAGYRYDASSFPSPLVLFARAAAISLRNGTAPASGRATPAAGLARPLSSQLEPHRHACAATPGLAEFPIAVTRRLRLPVYHTLSHLLPGPVFRRALASLLRSGRPVSYVFHAVDLLDLDEDGIDSRLRRHPGMGRPLKQKLARLRAVLGAIARQRPVLTFRQAQELVP